MAQRMLQQYEVAEDDVDTTRSDDIFFEDSEDGTEDEDGDDEDNQEDSLMCCVCLDGESLPGNEIVRCSIDGCATVVHKQCYRLHGSTFADMADDGDWVCDTCDGGEDVKRLECSLCKNTGGAYFRTKFDKRWVHCLCSTWIPELNQDPQHNAVADRLLVDIDRLYPERLRAPCRLCDAQGACVKCTEPSCSKTAHPWCIVHESGGWQRRSISMTIAGQYRTKWETFCPDHASRVNEAVEYADTLEDIDDHFRKDSESSEIIFEEENIKVNVDDDIDALCDVCCLGSVSDDNCILICSRCEVAVHQSCYDVPKVPSKDEEWFCGPCSQNVKQDNLRCELCCNAGGAYKEIVPGEFNVWNEFDDRPADCHSILPQPAHNGTKWVHSICYMWIPESYMGEDGKVILDAIPNSRWNLRCKICMPARGPTTGKKMLASQTPNGENTSSSQQFAGRQGPKQRYPASQCRHGKCTAAVHPMCAANHARGFTRHIVPELDEDGLTINHEFCIFCPDHRPERPLEVKVKKSPDKLKDTKRSSSGSKNKENSIALNGEITGNSRKMKCMKAIAQSTVDKLTKDVATAKQPKQKEKQAENSEFRTSVSLVETGTTESSEITFKPNMESVTKRNRVKDGCTRNVSGTCGESALDNNDDNDNDNDNDGDVDKSTESAPKKTRLGNGKAMKAPRQCFLKPPTSSSSSIHTARSQTYGDMLMKQCKGLNNDSDAFSDSSQTDRRGPKKRVLAPELPPMHTPALLMQTSDVCYVCKRLGGEISAENSKTTGKTSDRGSPVKAKSGVRTMVRCLDCNVSLHIDDPDKHFNCWYVHHNL